MNEWTDGYVADMTYTSGFYPEMTPGNMMLIHTLKSMRCGDYLEKSFNYCELGFGRGLGLAMMAAGYPHGRFWGVDLNPSHVVTAQRLAATAGLENLTLQEASFRQFAATETPKFDIIALHGVYSWISPENRQTVAKIIDEKLKTGGIVYISYNTLPGWAPYLGLRHILTLTQADQNLPSPQRIEKGLQLATALQQNKSAYFAGNPAVNALLEQIKGMGRNYVAHEYFNRDWHPQFFSEVANELSEAHLTFLASAHVADHFDQLNLPPEAIRTLEGISNPLEREGLRDMFVDQRFRRDLFVRGVDPVAGPEQAARLRSFRFTLLVNPENVSYKAKFRMGEFTLDETIYRPLVKLLEQKAHSLDEMLQHPTTRESGYGKLVHALSILMATGQITLAMPEAGEARRQETTKALNQVIMQQTRMGAEWPWLVSPVTGGGISINTMEQMFLYFLAAAPNAVVPQVWQVMQSTNQRLVVQGNVLKTNEENMQELTRMLDNFTSKRLPLLRRLQIANL